MSDSKQKRGSKEVKKIELKKISEIEYKGPKKTFTQELTKDEIFKLLEGYKKVEYDDLNKGFHVRYFSKNSKTGKMEFKMGGMILKIYEEFVVLSSGTLNWSVQKKDTHFYQQMSMEQIKIDLKTEFDGEIYVMQKQQEKYKEKISNLHEKIREKDKRITFLENELQKLKKK